MENIMPNTNNTLKRLLPTFLYRFNIKKLIISTLLTVLSSNNYAVEADHRFIANTQILNIIESALAEAANDIQIQFNAYDRQFNLKLKDNSKIINQANINKNDINTKFYAGTLNGIKNSWAHLSIENGNITGAIYDGQELFIINQLDVVEAEAANWPHDKMSASTSGNVIYRISEDNARLLSNTAISISSNNKQSSTNKSKHHWHYWW